MVHIHTFILIWNITKISEFSFSEIINKGISFLGKHMQTIKLKNLDISATHILKQRLRHFATTSTLYMQEVPREIRFFTYYAIQKHHSYFIIFEWFIAHVLLHVKAYKTQMQNSRLTHQEVLKIWQMQTKHSSIFPFADFQCRLLVMHTDSGEQFFQRYYITPEIWSFEICQGDMNIWKDIIRTPDSFST